MIQAIYMPAAPSVGEAVGQGIGSALQMYVHKQDIQNQVKQMQAFDAALNTAGSRPAALEIINKIPFKNIDQLNQAQGRVNQLYPVKDTTPQEISTFDPQTGQETKQFVPRGDVVKFSQEHKDALTKPEMTDFYKLNPDGSYKNLGRAPISARPEGSATIEELKLLEQQRTDKLKIDAADRADKRFNAQMDKLAETKDKEQASKQITELKAYNGVVSSMLNLKKSIGNNGEVIIDFGGDSKVADAYRHALTNGADYMKKYKGDINKAAEAALRDSGAFEKPAPEAPSTPAAPTGGIFSNLLRDLRNNKSTPAAQQSATPAPSPKADSFEVGKVYTDDKGNKAKYLGNNKWENQ